MTALLERLEGARKTAADVAYWRKAYEDLVAQTGRDLNDGYGIDPRRTNNLPAHTKAALIRATAKEAE